MFSVELVKVTGLSAGMNAFCVRIDGFDIVTQSLLEFVVHRFECNVLNQIQQIVLKGFQILVCGGHFVVLNP